jgi:hypothetical protein
MNKLEQETLEVIQEFLPRIALALEDIAKAMRLEMDYHRIAKEPSQGLVNNLTLEEVSKEYEELSK